MQRYKPSVKCVVEVAIGGLLSSCKCLFFMWVLCNQWVKQGYGKQPPSKSSYTHAQASKEYCHQDPMYMLLWIVRGPSIITPIAVQKTCLCPAILGRLNSYLCIPLLPLILESTMLAWYIIVQSSGRYGHTVMQCNGNNCRGMTTTPHNLDLKPSRTNTSLTFNYFRLLGIGKRKCSLHTCHVGLLLRKCTCHVTWTRS